MLLRVICLSSRGKSILPYIKGHKLEKPVYDKFIVAVLVVRYKNWKLAYSNLKPGGSGRDNVPGANAGSLFNLKDDLGETKDVSSQYPKVVEEMKKNDAGLHG